MVSTVIKVETTLFILLKDRLVGFFLTDLSCFAVPCRKSSVTTDVVLLSEAKTHCPQMVIDYLADRIKYVKEVEKKKL